METEDDDVANSLNLLNKFIQEDNLEEILRIINEVPVNSAYDANIFLAITLERRSILPHLLDKSGIDLNVLNGSGETLLHASLKCSDNYFLTELLKRAIPLNDHKYKNLVHNAVALNKPDFVQPLLEHGASMDNEDILGMTPLDIAIENSNLEIVSMFLYYNCDTTPKNGNISPFMYSMLCDSEPEIQLLLLEYETDMNNSSLLKTNLFIAIERCNHLIKPIIEYGADVNRLSNNRNAIEFILDHPVSVENFKVIWDRFNCETWGLMIGESILQAILNNLFLPKDLWDGYIRLIVESEKIAQVADTQTSFLISDIVEHYVGRNFKESNFYDLICVLLSYGCKVYAIDLHKIYNLLGSGSEVLRLLVHMDIEKTNFNVDFNFMRVRYNFDTPVSRLLRNFLFNMKIINMATSFKDILRYFTVPGKVKEYMENHKSVACPLQITWNNVPTLVELSRNEARDYICEKYNARSGSRYYSIVNHSSIPLVIKELLKFERPLYYDV